MNNSANISAASALVVIVGPLHRKTTEDGTVLGVWGNFLAKLPEHAASWQDGTVVCAHARWLPSENCWEAMSLTHVANAPTPDYVDHVESVQIVEHTVDQQVEQPKQEQQAPQMEEVAHSSQSRPAVEHPAPAPQAPVARRAETHVQPLPLNLKHRHSLKRKSQFRRINQRQ